MARRFGLPTVPHIEPLRPAGDGSYLPGGSLEDPTVRLASREGAQGFQCTTKRLPGIKRVSKRLTAIQRYISYTLQATK